MRYFSETEYDQLIQNGSDESEDKDYPPLAMLYMTNSSCIWLISELDPEIPKIAFGLCDLGMGSPELGYVDITEIEEVQNSLHILKRNEAFKGNFPVSFYSNAARLVGHVVTDDFIVERLNSKPE